MNILENKTILVTGGAGFIGSHIVDELIKRKVQKVIVLDNLSNGSLDNLQSNSRVEFVEGDIRDKDLLNNILKNCNLVCHQAAMGSVPKSMKFPTLYHDINVTGFLNILELSKKNRIEGLCFASSSSVYGNTEDEFKKEGNEGEVISPYALTKKINELHANLYSKVYGFHTIGLRYFNIFGPRQNPNGPYAAVIPLFINQIINNQIPTINGDPMISRDFTYVKNAVQANILALEKLAYGINSNCNVNIATENSYTLKELIKSINHTLNSNIKPRTGPFRPGDILTSKASIGLANKILGYVPIVNFQMGINETINWYIKTENKIL